MQAACEKLKLAWLPFEPTALPVTLEHWPMPLNVTSNEPESLAVMLRLVMPTSSTRTRSLGTKPLPLTRNGALLTGTSCGEAA
jgi:hypothetical protein